MKMDRPEKEIILYCNEDRNDDVIDEDDIDCSGVIQLIKYSRPVERLEP